MRSRARSALLVIGALAAIGVSAAGTGCAALTGTTSVPDPNVAATDWADAAAKCDGSALYEMLSKRSRATTSRVDFEAAVKANCAEVKAQGVGMREAAVTTKGSEGGIHAIAIVTFDDGKKASLVLRGGRFFVQNAMFLPGGAATKEEAVTAFHEALKTRSYSAILRLLSPALRAAVEAQLEGIEKALDEPDALQIPQDPGDEIEIKLENGHKLRLKRIDKTWYIDNFE